MHRERVSESSSDDGGIPTRGRGISLSLDWENMVKLDRGHLLVNEQNRERMRPTEYFCTGSRYTGTWNVMNMQGFGNYHLPHGVVYEGDMSDGMFHGEGTMKYPCGYKIMGTWDKGRLISFRYQTPDGLIYSDPWGYCHYPDRRFFIELEEERIAPAGQELLTNEQPSTDIPDGCYDIGDGIYNPRTKWVLPKEMPPIGPKGNLEITKDLLFSFTRSVTKKEEEWIRQHCRKSWDEPTGYRKDLYEHWFSGRETELQDTEDVQIYYNV